MSETIKIITQEGAPVNDLPEEEDEVLEEIKETLAKEINEGIAGFRKFKNSIIIKVGVVAVAIKLLDVAGKIIMENQRLKADSKKQDEEQ